MQEQKGKIRALCISEARGTVKQAVPKVSLLKDYGIEGDAHAGNWHRQVSLLAEEQVVAFNQRIAASKAGIDPAVAGTFGENILLSGLDLRNLPVGSILKAGTVVLKLSQIGKECHSHCQIFHRVGDCIMPREGVFATVEQGGTLTTGMDITVELPSPNAPLRAAVMTLSDKGSVGQRVDTSGPQAARMLAQAGYEVVEQVLL